MAPRSFWKGHKVGEEAFAVVREAMAADDDVGLSPRACNGAHPHRFRCRNRNVPAAF
jgi:hypothetical protein